MTADNPDAPRPADSRAPPAGPLIEHVPAGVALETLRRALEGTETGVWHWDVGRDAIRWSATTAALHGVGHTAAPVAYHEWLAGIDPADRDALHATVQEALRSGTGYEAEFRVSTEDAPPRWLYARGHVERDAQGRALAVSGLTIDVTERRRRDEERERLTRLLRGLQTVTDVTLAHLELDALLDELLGRLAELLECDVSKVLLYDERRAFLRVRASRGLDEEAARELRIAPGAGAAGRIASAGAPLILADTATEDLELAALRGPGRALAGVPLHLDGAPIGVLIVSSTARSYGLEDLQLLELVADRAARAVRQAELYAVARDAAASLQRSLLPGALPAVAGLDVAARYLPGQDGTEVGGDWYDLFALADGRVALVVGDVVGRGLHAAAHMGRVRIALRAYALEAAHPSDAVTRLDRFVVSEDPAQFTTLLVVFLDPSTGAAQACSAGHLPPLLVDPHGARALGLRSDPPLGVAHGPRRDHELVLGEGQTLLAYTDGLVEERSASLQDGIARAARAAACGGPAATIVQRVLGTLAATAGSRDDVAVIAVRRVGRTLERTFPARPSSVADARRELTAFAAAHGVSGTQLGDVALAVSEACTNVVVHAYRERGGPPGPLHVTARRGDDALEITIADEGCGVRPRGDSPGIGLGLQIISRTTATFEVSDRPDGGARLVLRFAREVTRPTMTP